jgi:hypothetical protein
MQSNSTFYIHRWETATHTHPVCEIGATTNTWFHRNKFKYANPKRSGNYDHKCHSYINNNFLGDVPLMATLFVFPQETYQKFEYNDYPLAFQLEQTVIDKLRSMSYKEVLSEWFYCPYDVILWVTEQITSRMEIQPTIELKSIRLSDISQKIKKGTNMSLIKNTKTRPIQVKDWMLDKLHFADDVICKDYNHKNKNGSTTPHWRFETDRGDYLYHCSTKKGMMHKIDVHNMLLELAKTIS